MMGFFSEIKNNVSQGFKDLKKDIFPDKSMEDEPVVAEKSVNSLSLKESSIKKNDSYSFDKDTATKNMVKNEIDSIISSLEKMDGAKNGNISKKQSFSVAEPVTVNQVANANPTPVPKPVKKKVKVETQDNKTIISKETLIAGNIASSGDLEIYGSVCGDVECKGKLIIGGEVTGSVVATDVCINTKKFEGDVCCEGCIEVGVGTVIAGNLIGTSAVISGAVKGEIDVNGQVVLDSTAVIKGNIKAKSVQMDNGAVLYGYCELIYASVNLDEVFKDFISEDTDNLAVEFEPENAAYLKEMENNYNAYMEEMQYAQEPMLQPAEEIQYQEAQYQEEPIMESLQEMQYQEEPIMEPVQEMQYQEEPAMEPVQKIQQEEPAMEPVQEMQQEEPAMGPVQEVQQEETPVIQSVDEMPEQNTANKEINEIEEALKYIKAQNLSDMFRPQDVFKEKKEEDNASDTKKIEAAVQEVIDATSGLNYGGTTNGYTTGAGLKNRFSNLESDKVYVGKDKSTYHNYNNSYTDNNNRGYGLY